MIINQLFSMYKAHPSICILLVMVTTLPTATSAPHFMTLPGA